MLLKSIDPTTGEEFARYDEMSEDEIDRALEACASDQRRWATSTTFDERAAAMRKAAGVLRERKDSLAILMAREMGKPVTQGEGEVEKCAWVCEHYADHARDYLADTTISAGYAKSYIAYRPLGVVLAVMPWNFPLWQVFRFAAPALMAGNGGALKHASNVTGCALAIESIFREAGFPPNIFRSLPVSSAAVARVLENPVVVAATLTGSSAAGRAVASKAGALLKKTVLELGGSDPYLVLEDANLESAAEICAASRLVNGGQSCVAAKRFLVVESVVDRFTEALVASMKKRKVGLPLERDTDVGPQARRDLRDELHSQVVQSVAQGARVVLGGNVPEGPGAFYPPTIVTDVAKGMPAFDEELFGPVASVVRVRDESHAIEWANASDFGLGAAVFTADRDRGERIARNDLDAGCCFVNDFVKSDPRLPFGGIKQSGYGRELAAFGIREFVNIKTVVVS